MQQLCNLIAAAMELAGADDTFSHNARLWQMEGGRACAIGLSECSQPVYVDIKTGEYDYGEPGGPGHAYCMETCRQGMELVPNNEAPSRRGRLR